MQLDHALQDAPATVTAYGFSETSEKKTPYLWIDFKFDEEMGPGGEEITIQYKGWLTDKNFANVLKALHALRWTGKSIMELDEPVHESLIGKRAKLTTEMEEYNNKSRAVVRFINDLERSGAATLSKQELKRLAAKFDSDLATFQEQNPVAVTEAEKEEIPF